MATTVTWMTIVIIKLRQSMAETSWIIKSVQLIALAPVAEFIARSANLKEEQMCSGIVVSFHIRISLNLCILKLYTRNTSDS